MIYLLLAEKSEAFAVEPEKAQGHQDELHRNKVHDAFDVPSHMPEYDLHLGWLTNGQISLRTAKLQRKAISAGISFMAITTQWIVYSDSLLSTSSILLEEGNISNEILIFDLLL